MQVSDKKGELLVDILSGDLIVDGERVVITFTDNHPLVSNGAALYVYDGSTVFVYEMSAKYWSIKNPDSYDVQSGAVRLVASYDF